MTVVLALLAVVIPASVTLIGYWIKQQSDKRLDLQKLQENYRSKVDLALRAIDLFGPSSDAPASSAKSAAGLLALAHLDFVDLALALLVDLWNPSSPGVSTETAIQIINTALNTEKPDVQLFAAELLIRNASMLDINNSLHWPSSVNNSWIPGLSYADKLLIIEALLAMAMASVPSETAIRALAVRLYVIYIGEPDPRIRALIGTLMKAIIPVVRNLGYQDFMGVAGRILVTLAQMEVVADSATNHPDAFIDRIIQDRSEKLRRWSQECPTLSIDLSPGTLASE